MDQILKPYYLAYIFHNKHNGEELTDTQIDLTHTQAADRINGCLLVLIAYEAEIDPLPTYFKITGRITP